MPDNRSNHFVFGLVTFLLVVVGSGFVLNGTGGGVAAASPPPTKKSATATNNDDETDNSASNKSNNSPGPASVPITNISPQYHPKDESLLLYHFASTGSTQDEAKKIVSEMSQECSSSMRAFCVTATEQTNGRGTSGRQWMGAKGNTFVTIGIQQSSWMSLKNVPLTLLPLRIGSLVANRIQKLLDQCRAGSSSSSSSSESNKNDPMVAVKWPNDVLVDEKKISGVLIESLDGWFLIGIGVNVAYAPSVPTSGPNHGRVSTCIYDFCPPRVNVDELQSELEAAAQQLGVDLAYDLHEWISTMIESKSSFAADFVLDEWKQWVDWDMELQMRDTPNRERVRMTDLLPDGRVKVVGADGLERTLVSDYFL